MNEPKKILALDLGTHCGFAHNINGGNAGTWTLGSAKEITMWGKFRLTRRNDPRIHRLALRLSAYQNTDIVIFEDVEFSTYTLQTQLWSAFRTVVWLILGGHPNRIIECIPVSTLKKFATGHGGATKEMMSAALKKKFPELWRSEYDDNTIDALWLLKWAQQNLTRV